MISVHISYGSEESGNWEQLAVIPLVPYSELYPEIKGNQEGGYGVLKERIKLPKGEVIYIGVAFLAANNSINFILMNETDTLLNIGTFKRDLNSFDPAILFLSPGGTNLQFMFSSKH